MSRSTLSPRTLSPDELSGYCAVVLERSTGGPWRTMPMGGGDIGPFAAHVNALKQSCTNPVSDPKPEVGLVDLADDRSDPSAPVSAVAAPGVLPPAHFDPSVLHDGQELVTVVDLTRGSRTRLEVVGVGPAGQFTTPDTRRRDFDVATPLGRPLGSSDELIARQELCDLTSDSPETRVARCPELPAPRIEQPRDGDTFVIVADAVPGARVRVYDANGVEIGDGSGPVVLLSRPLQAGETLTVVQQLGECAGDEGYRIRVIGKG